MTSTFQALATTFRNASPVPLVARAQSLVPSLFTRDDREAQLNAMGAVGTLFAIIDGLAEGTAQVEWKLYRKQKPGRSRYRTEGSPMETRTEVTQHLALKVWNQPNPFMTQQLFVETVQQHHGLTGEQWWMFERNAMGWPTEIWPMPPFRMDPNPDPKLFIDGYTYTAPDGTKHRLENEEVVFLRTPDPANPYRGLGPVRSIRTDLESIRYSAEWNRNFFLNGAEPGGIIRVPRDLSDDEFDQIQRRWNSSHRGTSNAHRVAIMEGEDAEWIDRKFSQRDMEFTSLRTVSGEMVREAFRFPKPMLGTVEDVNRANAEAAEYVFAKWLIVPRLERIKQALNMHFLPLFYASPDLVDVEFDYCSPVPEDREADNAELKAKADAVKALIDSGVYGPSALEAVGMPEMAFGQPDADPDRELLVRLVTTAPTLAPTILPMLGFELPEEKPAPAPSAPQEAPQIPGQPGAPAIEQEPQDDPESPDPAMGG